ncbi:hypothetical protein L798_13476 [Zootermopsis nevadensis]|uniref:Uncharacterized protein n=1 Tax=Zootermopsis nevadensis TaxID=136037 RepID=A0A067R0V9_ZOONE|nr:hypothetical protein L798_13476 [Zootermopsis nevadensis]
MTDKDAEGISTRISAFSAGVANNFVKMRENAFKRNKSLLKELEVESAKLRSRTYFCPTELQLNKLKAKYEDDMRTKIK